MSKSAYIRSYIQRVRHREKYMSKKVRFTANRISQIECPSDKQQSFIWDSTTQGLGLRKTPRGNPSYIFQSRFNGKSIRISIGSPKVWSIGDA